MIDPIKESFNRVRADIEYLYQELEEIKQLLYELKDQQTNRPTDQHIISTHKESIPTHDLPQYSLKSSNNPFSTRNEGVPTNQQTNQPTNQHPPISTPTHPKSAVNSPIDHFRQVSEILATLDDLKKEVRLKFKRLTDQEMLVFGTIYQLEEQGFTVDYSILAQKTGLTEISIRDYVRKILQKQIPLDKFKESNKKVILSIPQDLKRVASLTTISQLRDL